MPVVEPEAEFSPPESDLAPIELQVEDPGGRLQDIPDPAVRSQVARQRGRKGALSPTRRKGAGNTPIPPGGMRRNGLVAGVGAHDPLSTLRHEAQFAKLSSDRIRAATELARAERAEHEQVTDEVALWLARRDTIALLPPQEALGWLLGEMAREEEGQSSEVEEDDEEGHDILPP